MAFISCRNCDWSQDDFWDTGYNPLTYFCKEYTKEFLAMLDKKPKDRFVVLEAELASGILNTPYEGEPQPVDFRNYFAYKLNLLANSIEKMRWPTYEDWINEPNKVCPKCGSKHLTVD